MSSRRALLLVTDLEIGGTPTVVRELATRLRSESLDVEVACLSKWGPVADQLRDAGVNVRAFDCNSTLQILRAIRKLISLIRAREIDTVLSFLVHANAVAAIAARFCGDVRFYQSIQTSYTQPRWHWFVQSMAQRSARAVIVPSPSAAQVAVELAHVPPEKLVVIPNAIDADAFAQNPAPVSPVFPIGFIGRLDPVKRVPLLVREFSKLHDLPAHLHIFGDGPDRPQIVSEIAGLQLEDRVTLHGTIDRPQFALQQIAVLVLPSFAEGFGLVLIEAMAAAVPVIGARVPGIRDVIRNGETGILVDVAQPGALASAIRRLIDHRDLRVRLAETARKDVRSRYGWTTVLNAYRLAFT